MTFKVTDKRKRTHIDSTVPNKILSPETEKPEKTLDQLIAECYIEPTFGRLVIIEDEFRYKGKMIIPETAKRKSTTGTILKMNLPKVDELPFIIGDRILTGTYSGTMVEFDGVKTWRILSENEVLAIVNDKSARLTNSGV